VNASGFALVLLCFPWAFVPFLGQLQIQGEGWPLPGGRLGRAAKPRAEQIPKEIAKEIAKEIGWLFQSSPGPPTAH
jgi:hypothetical protein